MVRSSLVLAALSTFPIGSVTSFVPAVPTFARVVGRVTTAAAASHSHQRQQQPPTAAADTTTITNALPSAMRAAEIRAALNEMRVDYADCFDKESLAVRLQQARTGSIPGHRAPPQTPAKAVAEDSKALEPKIGDIDVASPAAVQAGGNIESGAAAANFEEDLLLTVQAILGYDRTRSAADFSEPTDDPSPEVATELLAVDVPHHVGKSGIPPLPETGHTEVPKQCAPPPILGGAENGATMWCPPREGGVDATENNLVPPAVAPADIASLRVAEIRAALHALQIDYSDCFEKESLVVRLREARAGKIPRQTQPPPPVRERAQNRESVAAPTSPGSAAAAAAAEHCAATTTPTATTTPAATLAQIRALSVPALRAELSQRAVPRKPGMLLEKEDLVRAVAHARAAAAAFSATGALAPGRATDVTGLQLQHERVGAAPGATPRAAVSLAPLLVDVYAAWCGPCQLMAGTLSEAAAEWGGTVRVVKLDRDRYSDAAGQLRVQGLPTLVLFAPGGREMGRIEGALPKEQLLRWVKDHMQQ